MSTITTADLLDEYARALRGSWGGIDGRSEQLSLNRLSAAIRKHGNASLTDSEVVRLRWDMDVCPHGGGHWTEYCDEDDECEAMTAPDVRTARIDTTPKETDR